MLNLYRRHRKNCEHTSRKFTRCKCPVWVEGTLGGEHIRESLATRDWTKASAIVHAREAAGAWTAKPEAPPAEPLTIAQAHATFVADVTARNRCQATIRKYKQLFRQLDAFSKDRGLRYFLELTTPALSQVGPRRLPAVPPTVSPDFERPLAGDLILVRLEEKKERRQFEVAAAGAWRKSEGISLTHQVQLTRSEVRPGVYKIGPAAGLSKGEYGLYLKRGQDTAPYMYDFSVE